MVQLIANVLEYILIFVIIIGFGSPYAHAVRRDYFLMEITAVITVVVFFMRVTRIKRRMLQKYLIYFIPYLFIILIYMILRVDMKFVTSFAARFVIILPFCTFLFCHYIEINRPLELFNKYVNVMTVISVVSLFFWLFGSQLHFIQPSGYILAHWGSDANFKSYFGLYFESQHAMLFGMDFGMRNQGLFCEGPMYSLNLVFSIAISLFLLPGNKKKIRKKQIILIVTLITTFTTTGLILLITMISLKFVINGEMKRGLSISKLFAFTIAVPLALLLAYYIFLDKSTSGSWMQRVDDFYAGMKAWLRNPILGNGWNENETVISFMGSFRSNTGFSNSIMMVLAQGGVLLFSLYLIPIFCAFMKSFFSKDYNVNSFTMIFIVEFIFTIFTYSPLMLFLLSFFISYIVIKEDPKTVRVRSSQPRIIFR